MSGKSKWATYPKLHNAMWPGLVGKGASGGELAIDLDTMLQLTADAEVDGVHFDGVDLYLSDPHTSISIGRDEVDALADKVGWHGLQVGSCVAPVWSETGGGSPLDDEGRRAFALQVRRACSIASQLKELGVRSTGIVRIDSATSVAAWAQNPASSSKIIADTFREASIIAEDHGERLAIEGEICWGGMHSWRHVLNLLEAVGRPEWLGFQADMAHTMLFALGHNAVEHALIEPAEAFRGSRELDDALLTIASALRPWTIDFHVAQNDGTVKGSGSHDKTGRHCIPEDPAGLLDVTKHAGFWLRDDTGALTKRLRHICWDGCMFPNALLLKPSTWQSILQQMIAVRAAHGWRE